VNPEQRFDSAVQHHRAGRFEQASELCRRLVAEDPADERASYVLGLMALQASDHDAAVHWFERCVALSPKHPGFLANLGEAYRRAGKLAAAERGLARALELRPDLTEAWFNLGLTFKAAASTARAVACFRRAVELAPGLFAPRHELGVALAQLGELSAAIEQLRGAVELNPTKVEAHVDLATALRLGRRREEAVPIFERALTLAPDFALTHNNLGVTLLELRDFDRAIESLRRALALDPTLAEAHSNLGNALKSVGRVAEALEHYRQALRHAPGFAEAHANLVYSLSFAPGYDDAEIAVEARRFDALHAEQPSALPGSFDNERRAQRRLRVGYVSADFRQHVQALFMLPLLRHHDSEAVETFCYSNTLVPDALTRAHAESAAHFRSIVQLDDRSAAQLIRRDRIDVLVDLTMHMARSRIRLFAHRPAPVQLSWLAYPGTTGVRGIDYRLTDPHLDPPELGEPEGYSERSVRLPDTFWCFDPLGEVALPGPLPCHDAPFTFGCLNNFCKTNDAVFALWARVLLAVQGSRLLLLAPQGTARRRVRELFESAGVAAERVEFCDFAPRSAYLETYRQIDVALDTFPYNGHTTSLDAWWMGVPVLSLLGSTVAGRAGACHAANLGLAQWVARTPDEFVARARAFSADRVGLSALRASLRERLERSPLMDAPRFARHLESTYRTLFQRWAEEPAAPR
jgi:protein O-GlcNAc transferase